MAGVFALILILLRRGVPELRVKAMKHANGKKNMRADAPLVRSAIEDLGVNIGNRKQWCKLTGHPYIEGDPDIVAYDTQRRLCLIAEVEGASSGQPEQKLYKAIGQMVRTASNLPVDWRHLLVIVVYGERIGTHLQRAHALTKLGISGLALADDAREDRWLFGEPFPV